MPYTWEEVKQAVERNEEARLVRMLEEREVAEGRVSEHFYLVRSTRKFLDLLGGVVVGIHVAVMTLAFNYLLFLWILHVNFDS